LEVGTDDEALAIEVLQRREDILKGNHDDHDDDSIIDDIAPTFALVCVTIGLEHYLAFSSRNCN
jgi:hypothetical protein